MSHALSNQGRAALYQHFAHVASTYGAPAGSMQFAATPSIAQRLFEVLIELGDGFLSTINMQGVQNTKGDKVGLYLTGRVASRTDTSGAGERSAKRLLDSASNVYELFATEFDVALQYALIDAWAAQPNFAARWQSLVRKAIANDMLQTGWTGTSAATATNLVINPNLQDLNKGWLQKIREYNAGSQRVLGGAKGGATALTLGETNKAIGGFGSLDTLVNEALQLIPVWLRDDPRIEVFVGKNILDYQKELYYDAISNDTQKKSAISAQILGEYAGKKTSYVPFFPDSTLLITARENLSIYYQDSSVRRIMTDNPKKNQVEDFNSMNLGYVVEEEKATALLENITFK